jgi:pyruvate dehydrogenase complex dehydrogenase (E1) component
VIAALDSLAAEGVIAPDIVASAIERYDLNHSAPPPWSI